MKTPIPESYISREFAKVYELRESKKTEEDKEKEALMKKKKLKKSLIMIDKALRTLEFFVLIEVGNITFSLTEKAVGNHKLLGLGI